MKMTTIQISRVTRESLKKLGFKGETYGEVLQRLIKISKEVARK